MITYSITASITYSTTIKPESGLEEAFRKRARWAIENEGIETFLDRLTFEKEEVLKISDEELDYLIESGELLIPVEGLKETLLAVSLGLLELEWVSPEQAIEALKKFEQGGNDATN